MNLVVDVGNTAIKFGVYQKSKFITSFVCRSDVNKFKGKNVTKFLVSTLKEKHISLYQIEDIMLSSVVPKINKPLKYELIHLFGLDVRNIEIIRNDLKLYVDYPEVVGQDLLGDIYGVIYKKLTPCVIVDLGTADKYLLINKANEFTTCLFTAGIETSINYVSQKAALLEPVKVTDPLPLLEIKDTPEALVGGVIYTAARSIEGICEDYQKAVGYKLNKVITGGNAKIVYKYLKDGFILEERLILDALNEILLRLKGDSDEL